MVYRDPQTGKFVAGQDDDYADVEVVSFSAGVGVQASEMTGATGFSGDVANFEGEQLLDYDEIVDRNERLDLLYAAHRIGVFTNSTQTEDGTLAATVEISSSPSQSSASLGLTSVGDVADDTGLDVVGNSVFDDSIDVIGRPLMAVGTSAFSDTATGVGGGGAAGHDEVEVDHLPAQVAEFHPRDELFLNGELNAWNVDDAGLHVFFNGQHVYGVAED